MGKVWKCPQCGATLGVAYKANSGVTRLRLYRHANTQDVMAEIEGLALHIRCDVCGSTRTWRPGPKAARRQALRYGGISSCE